MTATTPPARERILTAAREEFARAGYDGASVRDIARAAAADPALVIRHYGSKEELFLRVTALDLALPDLTGVDASSAAAVLVPHFVATWREHPAFQPLLRSAATSPAVRERLRALFAEQLAPMVAALAPDAVDARAALLAAQLVGIAFSATVLEQPVLRDMDVDELVGWLAPGFAHILTAPRPGSSATPTAE